MGAAVVGEDVHPPPAVTLDGGPLHEAAEVAGQVHIGVIPGEMYRLCPHPVQQGYVVRGSQADVQSLREVHIGAALRKLQNQPFMVRAGQQIGE